MQVTEKKDWGITGITVDINPLEQYEVTHMVERFEDYLHANEAYQAEQGYEPEPPIEEMLLLLNFLRKIGLKKECQSTIFKPQEEEEKES